MSLCVFSFQKLCICAIELTVISLGVHLLDVSSIVLKQIVHLGQILESQIEYYTLVFVEFNMKRSATDSLCELAVIKSRCN